METLVVLKIFFSFVVLGSVGFLIRLYKDLCLKPEKRRALLRKQGIKGPSPSSFLYGNIPEMKRILLSNVIKDQKDGHISHDCSSFIFPFLEQWREQYGKIFMFSLGNLQLLYLTNPDVVKEMSTCTSLDLGKPGYQRKYRGALLGQGILTSNGAYWAHQRKIIAPELYMEKVKGMVNLMVESANSVLKSWESRFEGEECILDIRIDEDMRSFSGDVISRACFGSNFAKGKEIFMRLRSLQKAMSKSNFLIGLPALRYILPTKSNREIWRLEKEVHSLILDLVKERKETTFKKDLLQMILEGANNGELEIDTDQFIVDNCKNIYQAGYETTAVSASWILMLLASHPEWQDRVRAEVLEVCGNQVPDTNTIRGMKTMTMVINEMLRLYPPVSIMSREALKDMKFGDICVPQGVNLWIPVLRVHTDPEIWGPDALEFKPERFANGIVGACKFPYAYMPFGVGPRTCLGQYFALAELKVLISLIVSKFSFSLSPKYRHSPALRLVVEAEHGVNLLMKKL